MTALLAIAFPLCCLIALMLASQAISSEWVATSDVVLQARKPNKTVRLRRLDASVSQDRVAATPWAEPALGY